MSRKVLLTLPIAFGLVAATAIPASATPDQDTCALYSRTTTVVRICVDVDGNRRGTYVEAVGVNQPVVLRIVSATTLQCNNGGVPSQCSVPGSASNVTVTGYGLVTWSGAHGNLALGHTYRACATLTVNGESYTGICSGTRAN